MNGVSGVDILVREEELSFEEKRDHFVDALFPEGLGVVEPIDVVVRRNPTLHLLHFTRAPIQRGAWQRQCKPYGGLCSSFSRFLR